MSSPEPPAPAPDFAAQAGATSTDALAAASNAPESASRTRKGRVFAWGLWDWGSAAFNAVVTTFVFTVTLSATYDQAVTMSFQTVNGTATTGDGDYVTRAGTLTFAPGETTRTITIEVKGDNRREADEEYFYLDLSGNSSNSLFKKKRGVGTSLNDDR